MKSHVPPTIVSPFLVSHSESKGDSESSAEGLRKVRLLISRALVPHTVHRPHHGVTPTPSRQAQAQAPWGGQPLPYLGQLTRALVAKICGGSPAPPPTGGSSAAPVDLVTELLGGNASGLCLVASEDASEALGTMARCLGRALQVAVEGGSLGSVPGASGVLDVLLALQASSGSSTLSGLSTLMRSAPEAVCEVVSTVAQLCWATRRGVDDLGEPGGEEDISPSSSHEGEEEDEDEDLDEDKEQRPHPIRSDAAEGLDSEEVGSESEQEEEDEEVEWVRKVSELWGSGSLLAALVRSGPVKAPPGGTDAAAVRASEAVRSLVDDLTELLVEQVTHVTHMGAAAVSTSSSSVSIDEECTAVLRHVVDVIGALRTAGRDDLAGGVLRSVLYLRRRPADADAVPPDWTHLPGGSHEDDLGGSGTAASSSSNSSAGVALNPNLKGRGSVKATMCLVAKGLAMRLGLPALLSLLGMAETPPEAGSSRRLTPPAGADWLAVELLCSAAYPYSPPPSSSSSSPIKDPPHPGRLEALVTSLFDTDLMGSHPELLAHVMEALMEAACGGGFGATRAAAVATADAAGRRPMTALLALLAGLGGTAVTAAKDVKAGLPAAHGASSRALVAHFFDKCLATSLPETATSLSVSSSAVADNTALPPLAPGALLRLLRASVPLLRAPAASLSPTTREEEGASQPGLAAASLAKLSVAWCKASLALEPVVVSPSPGAMRTLQVLLR